MKNIELNDLVDKLDFDTPSSLPRLGVHKVGLHLIQMFLAFITLCVTAPIISAENAYTGSSQAAPNYTLAVTLITLFVSCPLTIFPWTMMSKKGFVSIRNFFLRPRTTVIFTCFMTMGWFAAMISMTVHSKNASNCAFDDDLKDDESYTSAWSKQCNCAKASAAFCWISFIVGVATVVCSAILLWHEKKLRHAELNNQITATATTDNNKNSDSSSTTFDDDARTIVNMKYSEEDKQPVANYDDSVSGISPSISPQMQETSSSGSYLPSPAPMASSITATGNDFASPYSPPATGNTYSPMSTPYSPQSNVMTSVGYAGSPYSTTNTYSPQQQQSYSPYQAQADYGSPYSYHQQTPPIQYNAAVPNTTITSPYPISTTTTPQPQAYRSSPLYQQTTASPTICQTVAPNPLSHQQQSSSQMYQQAPTQYNPQEYNHHLANI